MIPSLQIGQAAPQFSLPDQDGKVRSLSDYLGSWVLVYFYPKDDTPGCTLEACALRDSFAEFAQFGAAVLGISTDSQESHMRFGKKLSLPFPLLADQRGQATSAYGVHGKGFLGMTARHSFLVDPQGRIARIYHKVEPASHALEVLADITALQKHGAGKWPLTSLVMRNQR